MDMRHLEIRTRLNATAAALALAVGAISMMVPAPRALAEQPATTLQTLLDKQQIQDMLVDYYTNLGKGNSDFGAYYLPDGVINVNGLKGQGAAAIADVYKKVGAGSTKLP